MSASADLAGSADLITPIAVMVWQPYPDARPIRVPAEATQKLHSGREHPTKLPFPPGAAGKEGYWILSV